MASEAALGKHRHYDPSMSKRTRKPQVVEKVFPDQDVELPRYCNSINGSSVSSLNLDDELVKDSNDVHQLSLGALDLGDELQKDSNDVHRSSLKELMNEGTGLEKVTDTKTDVGDEVCSEMQEAAVSKDKNSLALVSMKGEGVVGVKTGGMVSRYVKVLSHLIKVKRGSKKKTVPGLLKP